MTAVVTVEAVVAAATPEATPAGAMGAVAAVTEAEAALTEVEVLAVLAMAVALELCWAEMALARVVAAAQPQAGKVRAR